MKHKYFEIYHYKNIKLTDIQSHSHDHYEILMLLSGNLDYMVDGILYSLEPHDFLAISPFQHHNPILKDDSSKYEWIVLWVTKNFLDQLSLLDPDIYFSFDKCIERQNSLIRLYEPTWQSLYVAVLSILDEVNFDKLGSVLESYSNVAGFLVHLNRSVYFQGPFNFTHQADDFIMNVISYIVANATEDLTLESIASHFYISQYHLSRLFKEKIGTSVYNYVLQRRLILAKNMILTDIPMSKVALECGFKDYAGFYRAFKKVYDVSPKEFKKQYS